MNSYANSLSLIMLLLLCSACSTNPNWRAPVETRSVGSASGRPTPAVQATPARTPAALPLPISPSAKSYTIQRDDTLFSIAWRSENQVEDLAQWNQLKPPYLIYPGQRLRLSAPPQPVQPKPVMRKPGKPQPAVKPPTPLSPKAPPVAKGPLNWAWPLRGELASTYKAGDPLHKGIRIMGKAGSAIHASESGRVIYSGNGLIGYGLLLIIKHNDEYLSAYGHNRKLFVKKGQTVHKGSKIAEMGTTNAGKPQLHFEIRRSGKPVNPLSLLPK